MSTARLDDDFWTDPKIKVLSPDDKLLFIWIFTNPYRSYCGLYFLPKPMISKQTGLSNTSIDRGINNLMDTGLVYYDEVSEVIFVKNMLKRQIGKSKALSEQQSKGIIKHLDTLHNCQLIQTFLSYYAYLKIDYLYTPIDTPTDTKSQSQPNSQPNSQPKEIPLSTAGPVDKSNGFSLNELAEIWNSGRPLSLSEVKIPFNRSDNRTMKKFNAIIKRNPDRKWWEDVVAKIHHSSFMQGKNDTGWKATLDYVIEKAEKIYDGHLIDIGGANQTEQGISTAYQWAKRMESKNGTV